MAALAVIALTIRRLPLAAGDGFAKLGGVGMAGLSRGLAVDWDGAISGQLFFSAVLGRTGPSFAPVVLTTFKNWPRPAANTFLGDAN